MKLNEDFNIDEALRSELTPPAETPGNESGAPDNEVPPAGSETPAEQAAETPAEQATFKLPDGRMVTPSQAQKEWDENFMPDYTRKSQELAELKKTPPKQSEQGESADGKDDSPIDQALAQEVDRVAKHLGYVKKDEVKAEIDSVVPRTAGAVRAEQLLNDTFTKLETELDGTEDTTLGVSKPKFDRQEIMEYVQGEMKQGNKVNLSPLQIAHILHPTEYALYDAAKTKSNGSVKEKAALPETEKGGNSGGGNPNPPAPKYDFENGGQSIEAGVNAILNTAN